MKFIITASQVKDKTLYLSLAPKKSRFRFKFQAGQYATISFVGNKLRKSPVRCFSIVSSATHDRQVEFAIRVLGDFTDALARKSVGSTVYLQGPYGEFCVDKTADKQIIMFAGGIGITPCLSIIRTINESGAKLPVLLLYSNRSGHQIPFHKEIEELQRTNKYFRAAFFITDTSTIPAESRQMLSGRIAETHIKQVTKEAYAGSSYFVCGPKNFMESTITMLENQGISESQIVSEAFTQASKTQRASGLSVRTATYAFSASILILMLTGVAVLDLSHYLPAVQALSAQRHTTSTKNLSTKSQNSNSSTATSQQTMSSPTTASGSGSSSSSGSSTTQTGSTNTSTTSNNSSYQPPVSSVS